MTEGRYKSLRDLPETRRPSEPELWGRSQVAEHLGTKPSNLQYLAGLPEPYQHLPGGTVWRADDVRKFAVVRYARQREQEAVTGGASCG